MNFGFTEEQEILRSETAKFLANRCPMDEARRIMEGAEGYSPSLWKEIAELGWTGLMIPEEFGGAGLGWVDLLVVLEETGRALFPSPLVSSTLASIAIAENGSKAQQERWLPSIADGSAIFSLALLEREDVLDPAATALKGEDRGGALILDGSKLFVTDAAAADAFVVSFRRGSGELGLAVVEASAEGVEVLDLPCIDLSKRLGRVALSGVRVDEAAVLPTSATALSRLLDHATAAVTAEAVGASEAAHALMVQYAQDRIQFGSPIGRYQGVKHPLAEMYVDIESFKSLLYYAAWCLDHEPTQVARHVSMAKAYAADAMTRIGIDAVELHGAIGTTWEYDAHLFLRRSKWVKSMYGGSNYHYDRVASSGGV